MATNASDPQLGYMGFEVKDLEAWERFTTDVLGLVLSERRASGGFSLRNDSRQQRFIVEPGPLDDVSVVGWSWPDEAGLLAAVARVREAGFAVEEGVAEEARSRRVARLYRAVDPGGMPLELVTGMEAAVEPFASKVVPAGFVAEELGAGHCVVSADDHAASVDFYQRLLGFRMSDRIVCEFHGYPVDIAFLHANGRHHSVAIGGKQKKRINHFMLEVRNFDDMGLGFDRCLQHGIRIFQTIGRHPNDRMVSFYARSPSGFQFEYGWGGRVVDDANWTVGEYHQVSEWGHHPPQFLAPPPPAPRAPGISPNDATASAHPAPKVSQP
jgi:2,3-dihydroxybiphenyl 1,2-dioxygenase